MHDVDEFYDPSEEVDLDADALTVSWIFVGFGLALSSCPVLSIVALASGLADYGGTDPSEVVFFSLVTLLIALPPVGMFWTAWGLRRRERWAPLAGVICALSLGGLTLLSCVGCFATGAGALHDGRGQVAVICMIPQLFMLLGCWVAWDKLSRIRRFLDRADGTRTYGFPVVPPQPPSDSERSK